MGRDDGAVGAIRFESVAATKAGKAATHWKDRRLQCLFFPGLAGP
jgi:hypothetical protein